MSSELFQFLWPVPAGGFLWAEGELASDEDDELVVPGTGKIRRVLVENTARSIYYRRYDPLQEHPALFRTFAALPSREDGICKFANEYGQLGKDHMVSVRHFDQSTAMGTFGETFDHWVTNIGNMKEAVDLWDLIRAGNQSALRKVIQWHKDQAGNAVVMYVSPKKPSANAQPRAAVIASANSHQEWLTQFNEGNLSTPAMAYLLRLINAQIENDISVRLRYDLDEGQAVLRMVPRTLLGCLWLELAQAISAAKSQRLCLGCTEWFEIQARGSRSDRQFCSQACRNRVYRQRKAKAQEMRRAGKTPKQIATLLDVDLASVKKWTA